MLLCELIQKTLQGFWCITNPALTLSLLVTVSPGIQNQHLYCPHTVDKEK